MTGRRPGLYWRVTWKAVSPLLLLTILATYAVLLAWTPLSYKAWDPQYVGPLVGCWDPFPAALQGPEDLSVDTGP